MSNQNEKETEVIDASKISSRKITIREALLAMAYKECKPGKWMKPIGYHLFSFNEENNQWVNWFVDGTNKISIWESKIFSKEKNPLLLLKELEMYTRINIEASRGSKFELAAFDL